MFEWWNHLATLTQVFFCGAVFFGILFLWQLVAALMGLGGHGDVGGGGGHDIGMGSHGEISSGHGDISTAHGDLSTGHGDVHGHAQQIRDADMATFQVLSIRSILAFFTLFTWYGFLKLMNNPSGVFWAVFFGLVWGLVAMFAVAMVFFLLSKLGETGTPRLESCVGTNATVYIDIPENGVGEIRCTVSEAVTMIKARGAGGQAIKAGTEVHVLWTVDASTVEVEPVQQV